MFNKMFFFNGVFRISVFWVERLIAFGFVTTICLFQMSAVIVCVKNTSANSYFLTFPSLVYIENK
jgi:hypothetical protein